MLTLAENVIVARANNHPPMLDKIQYSSWASHMLLYIKGKEHGKLLVDSVFHGPFKYDTVGELGTKTTPATIRDRRYDELTNAKKIHEACDIKATNIVLQGLPQDIYNLVNHHKEAKDIWDRVKLLIEGSEISLQERESNLYDGFDTFTSMPGETIHPYYLSKFVTDVVGIKNLLDSVRITAAQVYVNTALMKLVLLMNFKENILNMDQDSIHMVAASKVPMLKPSEFEIWRMRIKQYIQMIDYALWEVIENGATLPKTTTVEADLDTMSIDDLYNNLKVYEPEVKGMSSSSSCTQNIAFVSSLNNNTNSTNEAINTAHEVPTASTQVNVANFTNIDNLSDVVFECRALRNQDNKIKESSKRSVPVETSTSTALVSCDGLGGYDWSDQAEEGPNYARVAFSSSSPDSEVSNDSICLKFVEEKLKVYKANESIYLQDIKGLKFEIHIGEIAIKELRKKLKIVQKEKDDIQLNVDKFEHASKSLNKLIECQIVDNCKKGLGYENYNAFPPPYIGNFMPPTPDLSFTGLDEFVNKPIVENCKAMSSKEEPKVVRLNDDAPIIEEWVLDDEEDDVSQPKTE
ncbi:hypothetical protein Tco_0072127 [Tanacetum coccineum]